MVRHSELKTDLHYAKVRIFTGNASQVTPDFVDQLLIDDLNRVYRANGISTGQLIQLVAIASSGGVIVGNGEPTAAPTAYGLQYYDWFNKEWWISLGVGSIRDWKFLGSNKTLRFVLQNFSGNVNTDVTKLLLFYSSSDPSGIYTGHDFGKAVLEIADPFSNSPFIWSTVFNFFGRGSYAIKAVLDSGSTATTEPAITTVSGGIVTQTAVGDLTGTDSTDNEYDLSQNYVYFENYPTTLSTDVNIIWSA